MSEEKAKFRLKEYIVLSSNLNIREGADIDKNIDVEFVEYKEEKTEELVFEFKLGMKVKNANNSLEIDVLLKGIFEFDKDISDKEKGTFFNISAPAILFPYVRAYVSSLTGLSGISPIILPTLNLSQRSKTSK